MSEKKNMTGKENSFHMENFRRRSRYAAVFLVLILAFAAITVLNINSGNVNISIPEIFPSSETDSEKRCPVSHVPLPAIFWSVDALLPISELAEVQNGMIVLPAKSLDLTESFTSQTGAIHQIGKPRYTVLPAQTMSWAGIIRGRHVP